MSAQLDNNTKKPQQVHQIEVNLIQPNPHQPRKHLDVDDLNDLADSIKIHGVLEPIVVAHTPAGYQIIAGERRWRAAKKAGLKTVPAIVKKTSPKGMLEMSIVENLQRSDLNPLERAHSLNRLITEFRLTPGQVAKRVGKSPSYISNSIKLLKLPDALKDGLLSGLITEGHARALQTLDNSKQLVEAYKQVLKESASVRRAEEIARMMRAAVRPPEKKIGAEHLIVSKEIENWEKNMLKRLGANSKIKLRRSSRQTEVRITLKGSPDETQWILDQIAKITGQTE